MLFHDFQDLCDRPLRVRSRHEQRSVIPSASYPKAVIAALLDATPTASLIANHHHGLALGNLGQFYSGHRLGTL